MSINLIKEAYCKWCIIVMKNETTYYLHSENVKPNQIAGAFTWTKDREHALRFDTTTSAREYRASRLKERKDVFVKQLIF